MIVAYDTSRSFEAIHPAAKDKILELLGEWIDEAEPEAIFHVNILSSGPYCFKTLMEFVMPYLEIPTFVSRRKLKKELLEQAEGLLKQVLEFTESPIIEQLHWLGRIYGRGKKTWRLIIISDCIQDSKNLKLTAAYLSRYSDEEVVEQMLDLCPPPLNPPKTIEILWYPGKVSENKVIDPDTHERILKIFEAFLRRWGNTAPQFENLEVVK
jgi:hypothetical protein